MNFGADFLKKSGIFDMDFDRNIVMRESKILLASVLKTSEKDLFLHGYDMVANDVFVQFYKYLQLRITGMPVYKIIGVKPFYKEEFLTDVGVLDPRYDTEVLVEAVLKNYSDDVNSLRFLELGIGSGCVMLSVLAELKNLFGYGVDISPDSVKISMANAEKIGVQNRVKIMQMDWNNFMRNDFSDCQNGLDFIISNPPYIRTNDIPNLAIEVREFDPHVALDGGMDGLDCYRDIATLLSNAEKIPLKKNTKIFLEIGFGQSESVKKIFSDAGFSFLELYKDLSDVERVLVFNSKL
ncbi:MAG: peptide chain release factor N(5)-glutamine methyltransferase [Rickettsiales bacterium]|jgi:release factor glutamine methyltransferase|nr:peptide chain release factor N(5)-glutamine methyltransferase [Rickettsiales bacterium]